MILITGGGGFIGVHTARAFIDAGEDVLLTQHTARPLPAFLADSLGKQAFVESLDVVERDAWQDLGRRYTIDSIVHLAAPNGGRQGSIEDLAFETETNLLGLNNVLNMARAWGVRRLALASTIAIYGGVPAGPLREDMLLRTSATHTTEAFKKTFEIVGGHFCDRAGIDVVMMRIGGIYGPLRDWQYHQVTRLCHAALKGESGDPVGKVFAHDGSDYCYVRDCADAIVRVHTAPSLPNRVYNIGSGRETTHQEVVDAIRAVVPDSRLELEPGRSPGARPDPYLDISRLKDDLGWQPQWGLERAIPDYMEWLKRAA
jgi:UDP-glucose 4-epimerase